MSIVLLGTTSGSCTLQEQAVAGTTTITLPTTSGTMALTSDIPTGVSSLNGSTGALKGAVLTGTTSIAAGSTSVNVTSQMTNAGWYIVNVNLTLSASTSNTDIGFRTSTDNGSTFSSGASDYRDDAYNGGGATTRSFLVGTNSGTTNAVAWMNFNILMYTGNGTNLNFFNVQSSSGTSTTSNDSGGRFACRQSLTQINAIQVLRTSGTRTMSSGTINVYYLGQ